MTPEKYELLPALKITVDKLSKEFNHIPSHRIALLAALTTFIQKKVDQNFPVQLNFICTHNSRRSHIAQLWAQAAACHYGVQNVHCFSGGTEATAFNPRAVKAMRDAGFAILAVKDGNNPVYETRFSETGTPCVVFSKRYDDAVNCTTDFLAVMTCSHADKNCPLIPGAIERVILAYDDPKDFDGTLMEAEKYRERVEEIGRDILFAFSKVSVT